MKSSYVKNGKYITEDYDFPKGNSYRVTKAPLKSGDKDFLIKHRGSKRYDIIDKQGRVFSCYGKKKECVDSYKRISKFMNSKEFKEGNAYRDYLLKAYNQTGFLSSAEHKWLEDNFKKYDPEYYFHNLGEEK